MVEEKILTRNVMCPLILTKDGRVIAADCRVTIDDSSTPTDL